MKRLAVVSRAVLALAVLMAFATCEGGAFVDPGRETSGLTGGGSGGGGGGGGGGLKPARLRSNASLEEALAKADEIIAYCYANPGRYQDLLEQQLPYLKEAIREDWDEYSALIIDRINEFIDDDL
jgi:hypothetical protein